MRAFSAVVVALLLGACASRAPGARLIMPRVHVQRVNTLQVDSVGLLAKATMRVENPNPFPIRLSKVTYDVVLDQRITGHGETESGLEIPGYGAAETPVWMRAPMREALAAGAVLMLMGEVPYELRMTAYVWTPLKDLQIPVSDEGTVRMQDLLPPGLGPR